jgi:hypothetical protein
VFSRSTQSINGYVGMDDQSTQERYKRWDGLPIYTRTIQTLGWMTNLHKNGTNVGMDDQSTQERYERWNG